MTLQAELLKDVDKRWWNARVASVPEGTLFQTSYWADFLAEYMRYDPQYLLVRDEAGEVVGLLLFFRAAYGHYTFFERPFERATIPFLKKFTPSYTWLHGPIALREERRLDMIRSALEAVERLVRQEGGVMVSQMRLPIHGVNPLDVKLDGFQGRPWATLLVDLTPDEDVLWGNLRQSARKAIKHAQRDEISVERINTLDELHAYYEFACDCIRRRHGRVFSFANMSVMWKHLKPQNSLEIFVARHEGRMIGGLGIWAFNGVITEWGALQSAYSFEKKLYGSDLIKWEVIRWGHQQGYRIYDLAGVAPEAATEKEKRIDQFKEKWGGMRVDFCEYTRTFNGSKAHTFGLLTRAIGKLPGMRT